MEHNLKLAGWYEKGANASKLINNEQKSGKIN
jgi:hypothetical protein